MLTGMTDADWMHVVEIFRACRSRRGDKGRDDRTFLEAIHYFSVHSGDDLAVQEFVPQTTSVTPIERIASATLRPCETNNKGCRLADVSQL